MVKDRVDVSDKTAISMPMRNLISILAAVGIGVYAFFGIQERLNNVETRNTLMEADLLKKAEQTPKNLEIYMLIEHNAKSVEKITTELESMMHNKINIDFLKDQVSKLQNDVESLKDKVRNNGSN